MRTGRATATRIAQLAWEQVINGGIRIAGGRSGHAISWLLERAAPWPRDRVAVLTYHRVAPPDERPDLHQGILSADPRTFREQISYLALRTTIVDLGAVIAAVDGAARLPPNAVLLTFDDAYADVADHAWPVLRELGLPAVMFVPTGIPDTGQAFWWDRLYAAIELGNRPDRFGTSVGELRLASRQGRVAAFRALRERLKAMPPEEASEMVEDLVSELAAPPVRGATLGWSTLRRMSGEGMTMAPHSRSHPILVNLSDEHLRDELERPLEDLRREIGVAPPVLAYPSGIHDARVRAATRAAGYRLAFTTHRSAVASLRRSDPMALPRINVGRRSTIALLRLQLAPAVDRLVVHRDNGVDATRFGRGTR